MTKTYSELIAIPSFINRFRYLKLGGTIGEETFGSDRWVNQKFYTSTEWRRFRNQIIARDFGCDLAHKDHPFANGELIVIHHINPINLSDIIEHSDFLINPENAIAVRDITHKAIHYGDESLILSGELIERKPNDTCPWR